jgi:6-phosphogluconolactonase (cycloisomerase 2 family)
MLISVQRDNRFIIASNRNDSLAVINDDTNNTTQIPSDSLVVYQPLKNGTLQFVQLAPAFGSFPRHFQFSNDDDMLLVSDQMSSKVNVLQRDKDTGKLGKLLAGVKLNTSTSEGVAGVFAAIWDE